ncbi:MAG: YbbC/YhhH family protein [Bacteroidetes bacterium]|nr:YbbC/YhhH family protein [Bacteroidota bacterium]
MRNKLIYLTVASVVAFSLVGLFGFRIQQQTPTKNYVPNELTAKKIAEAILIPIYGEEQIEDEKPFKAKLVNDSIWVVEGTQKEVSLGGVFYIEIQKSNCTILKVTHGK